VTSDDREPVSAGLNLPYPSIQTLSPVAYPHLMPYPLSMTDEPESPPGVTSDEPPSDYHHPLVEFGRRRDGLKGRLRPTGSKPTGRPKGSKNRLTDMLLEKADGVADTMLNTLDGIGYSSKTVLTTPQRMELAADVVLSIFQDAEWRKAFATACLLSPIDAAKLAISMRPKDVHLKAAVQHSHVVLVPHTVTEDQWNEVHEKRRQLADGDWGTELSDVAFASQEEAS